MKKSKCGVVKNPCKYCLTQVSNRNGLQCKGACKKWAHYKCLQYTPGKISDIKAGLVKVLCPCPDCNTREEKEYLVNPPYTCSNQECPGNARGPIKCDSDECPLNRSKSRQENNIMKCSTKTCASDAVESRNQTKCPRKTCPAALPSPNCSPIPKSFRSQSSATRSRTKRYKTVEATNSNSSCDDLSCPNKTEDEEQDPHLMVNALQEMNGTVGMLSKQIRELMCKLNKMVDDREIKMSDRIE